MIKIPEALPPLQTGLQWTASSPFGQETQAVHYSPLCNTLLTSSPLQSSSGAQMSCNFTNCHVTLPFQLSLSVFAKPCSPGSDKAANNL